MISRILLILLFLTPNLSYAKINIITSITPIASLVAMVAGDKADITVIAKTQACPHHYALKPSDLKGAENADLFVYIDDDFDVFAKLLLAKSRAKVLKISKIEGLKLVPHNWHLWLLPENAELILRSAEKLLSELSPENREFFKGNLKRSLAKMQRLEKQRQNVMASKTKFILLTDSAEYFFMNTKALVQKLYQRSDYSSIKMLSRLKEADSAAIYIISPNQDLGKFRHLLGEHTKIIALATENWEESTNLEDVYYAQYEKMLRSLDILDFLHK